MGTSFRVIFICFLCGFYEGKIQRTRERTTFVVPFAASLSLPCALGSCFLLGRPLCGEVQVWPGTVVLQGHLLFRKLEWALFLPCRVSAGTTVLCLLSLRSPSLWPAVPEACSAGGMLLAFHCLTSYFHSFLSSFNPLSRSSPLSTLTSLRCI